MFICPLTQVEPGNTCRIKEILSDPNINNSLKELGFLEGVYIKIITKGFICQVCQSRFGICRKLAEKILVEKCK